MSRSGSFASMSERLVYARTPYFCFAFSARSGTASQTATNCASGSEAYAFACGTPIPCMPTMPSFNAMVCSFSCESLPDQLLDRLRALDADQLLVQTAVEIGQPVRIQAELVQEGRV